MQSRDFCFWLQGFFELNDKTAPINARQAALISRHLNLVFAHEGQTLLREPAKTPEPLPTPVPVRHPSEPSRETPPEHELPVVPVEPPRC
jgi:hypothetical protein